MYYISELRLGEYTLHIKVVPHKKNQLVLMSIGYYFGTTHFYIHICNKTFLRQIFFFQNFFSSSQFFSCFSTLPIIPTLLSQLIFKQNFIVIVDMYVDMCSTPISFFYISGHSCWNLIRIWFCLTLKEAKARDGDLERFIRFSERYNDTSSWLLSAGVLFSTLSALSLLFVFLDLASLLPHDHYLSAGMCCEVENTMLYRTLILC